jgi:hypothetical protein
MKDLRAFTGGLDYDSDYRLVGPTDYVDAINVTTGTSAKGSLKNMFGNVEINFTLPDGDNTCIGSLRNIKANSIIYFVFNSLNNHSILEYKCDTKVIEPILIPVASIPFTTEFLGFTKDNKIHSANVIDDILLWTDNNVSPRKINIKRAKDFLAQLPPSSITTPYDNLIATGTANQKIQFVESIKYKPLAQPSIGMGFDQTKKTNYLREKMIQAKYRYIYDDNEYSRWSDGSYVTLPQDTENIYGTFYNTVANNYAEVIFNTGHPTVKAIDIAFRFGNTGVWAKLDTPIYKYDDNNQRLINDYVNYSYNFYNDSVLVELAEDFNNYDAIPQLSKTQEIIDDNRLVYANNVEGYQNPSLNVSTSYQNISYDFGVSNLFNAPRSISPTLFSTSIVVLSATTPNDKGHLQNLPYLGSDPRDQAFIIPSDPSLLTVGTLISYTLNLTNDPNFITFDSYQIAYTITSDDLLNYPNNLLASLQAASTSAANPSFVRVFTQTITQNGVPVVCPTISYQEDLQISTGKQYAQVENGSVVLPLKKQTSYKKGAWHTFGIVYKDIQGRDGGVVTDKSMNLYVPYLPESNPNQATSSQYGYLTRAIFEINHQPPEWAYEYEIVYALNNLKKYTQFVIKQDPDPAKNKTKLNAQGNFDIDCSYIINYITKERVITSVDFQFEEGDLLRFISNNDYNVAAYVEAKVLAFDTTTNILTVSPYSTSQILNSMVTKTQEGMLCELFSYKSQSDLDIRPYFSIGETFTVSNPGTAQRAHRANVQNQSTTKPAILKLLRGDTYIYKRYFNKNTIGRLVESDNFSDIFNSKNIDISAVYGVIPEGKTKRYEQGIRYGGRYYPNTNINNILQFNGSDYDTLNTRYGPINKIATVGYVLKVLQTKKNTSIYINRSMIFNANGDEQLTLTDKVLGNKNPSELDYGCEHPESVCVDDRQLYFYDVNNGAFIQDAANGMVPVSEYKAKTYFRNISDKIKNSPYVYVYAGVDNFNNYINVTFIDHSETPLIEDQTIVYHPIDNRWKSRMSYFPEYYGSNALVFVSFMNGKLYEHNRVDAPRCNYYGNQHSMKVKLVSNKDYPKVKVYTSVAVYADKTFSSPNLGDISIEPSVNYPNGMESRLVEAKWRWKEGVLYAQYLRDGLTPNFPTVDEAIMGGRKLRGETLVQQLENTDTDEATLYSVLVHGVDSELSK